MSKIRPVQWLSSHATTGLTELPRNGAWVLSKVLGTPGAVMESASSGATDGVRRFTATVADNVPGVHDSVEIRLRRAEVAVARARKAEQEALAEAQDASARADLAKSVADEGKQRIRDAAREGKQEVDRRTQQARDHYGQLIEQEREKASREVAARIDQLTEDVQHQVDSARQDAEDAAARAQARIDDAHRQMASARELAAAATAAAREVADRAHQQAQAIADEAEQRVGSADRRLKAARGTEDALATTAARAVRQEQTADVPEKLTDYTKAELLDIAQPLDITGASRMPKSQLVRAIRTASRGKARTRTSAR